MSDYLALLNQQPRAYPQSLLTGVLRSQVDDFFVEERLGFEPEGEGEHVFVYVEKRGANTQFIADKLAAFAKLAPKDVSFSGMKDRWAVTRQWFSVHLPGKQAPDFSELNDEEFLLLQQTRHPRKLRRGVHKANYFRLRLRQLQGDTDYLAERIATIESLGVPNYFGEQRFGHYGKNLSSAQRWFQGAFKPRRNQQGIFLSAARAFLFNQYLSARISSQNWQSYMAGDLMMLAGTHSIFKPELEEGQSPDMHKRLLEADVHITGPLFGKASSVMVSDESAAIEQAVYEVYPELCAGLIKQGLSSERRALRVIPKSLSYNIDNDVLELSFELPSGSFATAVLAELISYHVAHDRVAENNNSLSNVK